MITKSLTTLLIALMLVLSGPVMSTSIDTAPEAFAFDTINMNDATLESIGPGGDPDPDWIDTKSMGVSLLHTPGITEPVLSRTAYRIDMLVDTIDAGLTQPHWLIDH